MNRFICAAIALVMAVGFTMAASAEPEMNHGIKDRTHEIHEAITKLENAKKELAARESGDEYGGHRAKAIEHIDAALGELKEALDYAHDHPKDEHHGDHDQH